MVTPATECCFHPWRCVIPKAGRGGPVCPSATISNQRRRGACLSAEAAPAIGVDGEIRSLE